ncbi:MAG: GIY-YIG nuclease family protein [Thermoguttaceae bacterium]
MDAGSTTLAIQLPEKIDLIHKIPTGAPEAAERFWHERFKAKRKGGEWFALNTTDVKAFRRCKSM